MQRRSFSFFSCVNCSWLSFQFHQSICSETKGTVLRNQTHLTPYLICPLSGSPIKVWFLLTERLLAQSLSTSSTVLRPASPPNGLSPVLKESCLRRELPAATIRPWFCCTGWAWAIRGRRNCFASSTSLYWISGRIILRQDVLVALSSPGWSS